MTPRAHELTADAVEPRRRATDPLWWRVLDRFGLPTLLVLFFLVVGTRWMEEDRKERRELLARVATAVENNTAALVQLAAEERAHADAVRMTWPKVKYNPKEE